MGFNQFKAVIAEIHIGLIDKHGGRAEADALNQLLRMGPQPRLNFVALHGFKGFGRIHAARLA